jgi:hypothetical protein
VAHNSPYALDATLTFERPDHLSGRASRRSENLGWLPALSDRDRILDPPCVLVDRFLVAGLIGLWMVINPPIPAVQILAGVAVVVTAVGKAVAWHRAGVPRNAGSTGMGRRGGGHRCRCPGSYPPLTAPPTLQRGRLGVMGVGRNRSR